MNPCILITVLCWTPSPTTSAYNSFLYPTFSFFWQNLCKLIAEPMKAVHRQFRQKSQGIHGMTATNAYILKNHLYSLKTRNKRKTELTTPVHKKSRSSAGFFDEPCMVKLFAGRSAFRGFLFPARLPVPDCLSAVASRLRVPDPVCCRCS